MALTPLRWIAIAIAGMLAFCILTVDRLPSGQTVCSPVYGS